MMRHASQSASSFPLVPTLLVAAFLTALGAIAHSGSVRSLYSSIQEIDGLLYDTVTRNPHRWSILHEASPRFNRTKYTFDSFVVAGGIDLAGFGLEATENEGDFHSLWQSQLSSRSQGYFELFEDFDLSHRLKGNETWIELLEYRRDATHPSLSFYVDKVAFKRWLVTSYATIQIEGPKSYMLKYASELHREAGFVHNASHSNQQTSIDSIVTQELLKGLPTDLDYAAKPTHLSCSGGVWLVHNDLNTNTTYVGNGKKKMKVFGVDNKNSKKGEQQAASDASDVRNEIAKDLSSNLQKVQEKCGRTVLESYALRHVRPGVVVEERFTQPKGGMVDESDNEALLKGGMEFKVFTIWGRAWLTVWRPGTDGVKALFFRNGTNLVFDKTKTTKKPAGTSPPAPPEIPPLPEWIDWDRVISMGETLGQHKDMFRTDIFVGVATANSEKQEIRYVVSETEIHPTPLRGFEKVFEEAGRLWLAGYYMLSQPKSGRFSAALKVIPNTEVPSAFYNRDA